MTGLPNGFYVTGGTLRRDAPCYVKRRADVELFEGLADGQFCYVLTARQMGKSSLMVRTAARLREEGCSVAVLDLTAIGQQLSAEQWYDGLLYQLGQQLGLADEIEAFWQAQARAGPLQRWARAVREVVLPGCLRGGGPLVIFIDEIDAVRSLPFSTDEFFAAIREFYNCLLGVATPSDLIRDTRTTPFNIGRRIELDDFAEAEAAPLAQGLGREADSGARLLRRVLYWTGGHPYLTQRLCQAVAQASRLRPLRREQGHKPEACATSGRASILKNDRQVDRLCAELFLSPEARERDDNLLFVRERMLRGDADLAGLLQLYAAVRRGERVRDDEANPLAATLRLSGITRAEGGRLKVRNRIYAAAFDQAWVRENLPDAELRRQRAAYRRGAWRAVAASAVIVLLMAGLVWTALRQRERAEQGEQKYRRLLYAAQMNLAQQDAEAGNFGRLAETLASHQPGEEDLRGFEWYYFWRLAHGDLMTLKHASFVSMLAFTPDGNILVTGEGGGKVRLWEADTGRELAALDHQGQAVTAAALAAGGTRLVTGSAGRVLRLWDAASRRELSRFTVHVTPVSLALSPDGQRAVFAGRDKIAYVLDAATGRELASLKGHTDVIQCVAFSPDGSAVVTASKDQSVRLWDTATGREVRTFSGHTAWALTAAFSPDGKKIASGDSDYAARLWDAATGRELAVFKGHTNVVGAAAFSPDGARLATAGDDRTVKLWDVAAGREMAAFRGHAGAVQSVAFSPDGRRLASGSTDQTVKIWDAANQPADTLRGHHDRVLAVTFSPDGRTLATGGVDRTVRLWDAATGRELKVLGRHTGEIWAVAFSPDGRRVASGSYDHTVRLWDAATGQILSTWTGHTHNVYAVAFSPDGKMLASASHDETAKIWEVTSGREMVTLNGHARGRDMPVRAAVFSPDGKILATGSRDKTVKLWDAATWRELATLSGHTDYVRSVAFSPDGKRLASAGYDGVLKLWDVGRARETATLSGHGAWVYAVTFSPDGRRVASGSYDQTVKIWDAASGRELTTLEGHTGYVYAVAFSPDGRTLATASADGTARLWRAAAAEEVARRMR
jgi:WD40 repeat protein